MGRRSPLPIVTGAPLYYGAYGGGRGLALYPPRGWPHRCSLTANESRGFQHKVGHGLEVLSNTGERCSSTHSWTSPLCRAHSKGVRQEGKKVQGCRGAAWVESMGGRKASVLP